MSKVREGIVEFFRELIRNRYLYLLALPGLIWLIIFAYVPMSGHVIAFKQFRAPLGLWKSPWYGFKNFEFFFSSKGNIGWQKVTLNTLYLNLLFLIGEQTISLTLAIFLNEVRSLLFKKISQQLVLLPYFISWLVVSVMFFAMFNSVDGLINRTLASMGIEGPLWYSKPGYWPALLTGVHIWKQAGYTSIIYLAAIAAIPETYYESAMIDGANRLQQMLYITLPLLRPTAVVLILMALGRMFYGNFSMIYSLVGENGILFETTNIIETHTFRQLRRLGNFGMTAAIGLYQSALGLMTVLFFNWLVKRIDADSGLF